MTSYAASGNAWRNSDIDLTFGRLAFEQVTIYNCKIHEIGGERVRLPRVEDLIIVKAIARRSKDLLEIKGCWLPIPKQTW
jgi:hypothetical protein